MLASETGPRGAEKLRVTRREKRIGSVQREDQLTSEARARRLTHERRSRHLYRSLPVASVVVRALSFTVRGGIEPTVRELVL